MIWCRLTITHFSISLISSIFVLLLHFTLPHLIFFFSHPTWCLTWVQHPHFTLAYLICHSFIIIFHVGILRSTTHDVFYALHLMHERYGDYIIRIIELSFLLFLLPYYLSLCYVPCPKTTLRPWLHTLYLTAHTWVILEIGWRLFLRAWWMRSYDKIYTGAYPAHRWRFLLGWCLALGHS